MNALRTARVLVIDDDRTEAMPVITAMGRLGIGCIHIPGDKVEELPTEPFTGIRLAFVDMLLGAFGDARQIGAHTANVLARSIAPGREPILVLLWTKHPEYVAEFKRALFERDASYRAGLLICAMEKPQRAEDISIPNIIRQVEQRVQEQFPLEGIWLWEQLSHDAATQTTAAIVDTVTTRAAIQAADTDADALAKWCNALSHVFRSLIQAVAGKSTDAKAAFDDLLQALVQIHQDRLENQSQSGVGFDLGRILATSWKGPSENERTALNTMLLTAPVRPDNSAVRPGNLYIPSPGSGQGCPHTICGVDCRLLAEEILRFTKDPEYSRLSRNLEGLKTRQGARPETSADATNELEQRANSIVEACVPVLLEVTASCDYAQRNQKVARFLGGLLVPAEKENLIAKKESNHHIDPVHLSVPGRAGAYHLVLSSRLLFSTANLSAITAPPLIRLRSQVLQEIQSWSASHGARPGYVKIENAQR